MNNSTSATPAKHPRRASWWFWLLILAAIAGASWYVGYVPHNNIAWASDYDAAIQQATQSAKPMLVFVHAQWCPACRVMKRNVWTDPQVEATVNSSFVPVMLDADDPAVTPLMLRYEINATPTTIITDSQGNTLRKVVGGLGKDEFMQLLQESNPAAASVSP